MDYCISTAYTDGFKRCTTQCSIFNAEEKQLNLSKINSSWGERTCSTGHRNTDTTANVVTCKTPHLQPRDAHSYLNLWRNSHKTEKNRCQNKRWGKMIPNPKHFASSLLRCMRLWNQKKNVTLRMMGRNSERTQWLCDIHFSSRNRAVPARCSAIGWILALCFTGRAHWFRRGWKSWHWKICKCTFGIVRSIFMKIWHRLARLAFTVNV